MCGRVNVSDLEGLDELIASIGARPDPLRAHAAPRWNVAPSLPLTVVHASDQALQAMTMLWGIEASWTTPTGVAARPLFNARAETVFGKASFREHAHQRRVVVPINGYYEWSRCGTSKQPWYIAPRKVPGLLLAGIWNGDTAKPACCVLTRDAVAELADVHSRMPVILTAPQALSWILDDQECQRLTHTVPRELPAAQAVGDHVNNARHDGPDCIRPAAIQAGGRTGSLFD